MIKEQGNLDISKSITALECAARRLRDYCFLGWRFISGDVKGCTPMTVELTDRFLRILKNTTSCSIPCGQFLFMLVMTLDGPSFCTRKLDH